MAKFNGPLLRALQFEGIYSFDPDDPGGESVRGISRAYWPLWSGWPLVDALKVHVDFKRRVEADPAITAKVVEFYRREFWDQVRGDEIPRAGQAIAEEVFDCAINPGIHPAGVFLQTGLNVLNRQAVLYDDLEVDGVIGPQTLAALRSYLETDAPAALLAAIKVQRGAYYLERIRRSEKKEKFARGWLKRVMA